MFKLYVDEDSISREFQENLRSRGFDVVTAYEAGNIGVDDRDQLEFAVENERVLFSYNIEDFHRIHEQFRNEKIDHYGILLAKQQRYPAGVKAEIISYIDRNFEEQDLENRLYHLSNFRDQARD